MTKDTVTSYHNVKNLNVQSPVSVVLSLSIIIITIIMIIITIIFHVINLNVKGAVIRLSGIIIITELQKRADRADQSVLIFPSWC